MSCSTPISARLSDKKFLQDPRSRLNWATRDLERLARTAEMINSASALNISVRQEKRCLHDPGKLHVRWVRMTPAVPDSFKFEIADLSLSLRACLDIAIQEVCQRYANPEPEKPQYPIIGLGEKSRGLSRLCSALPPEFADALRRLQPRIDESHSLKGRRGNHRRVKNGIATTIRDIANIEKHRRTADLISKSSSWREHYTPDIFERVTDSSDSAWRHEWESSLEIKVREEHFGATERFDPFTYGAPMFHGGGLQFYGENRTISIARYLHDGPQYVREVLNALEKASRKYHARHRHRLT